uniref:Uncharacterized protein n=1 Tax=Aegilops tauschii subsp. strangulata TaxID=200361 RepID=A0A453DDB5_AEGTS
ERRPHARATYPHYRLAETRPGPAGFGLEPFTSGARASSTSRAPQTRRNVRVAPPHWPAPQAGARHWAAGRQRGTRASASGPLLSSASAKPIGEGRGSDRIGVKASTSSRLDCRRPPEMAIRRGSSCAVLALLALASVAAVSADVFFQEKFEGELAP